MADNLEQSADESVLDIFAVMVPTCKKCGSTETRQGPGAGPHFARLVCAKCGRFIKWLGKPASQEAEAGW
jgi:hypothetical protein